MTDSELIEEVNNVFTDSFEIPPEKIKPEAQIFVDLGLDSLGRSPIAEIERVLFQNGAGRVLWGESRIDLH